MSGFLFYRKIHFTILDEKKPFCAFSVLYSLKLLNYSPFGYILGYIFVFFHAQLFFESNSNFFGYFGVAFLKI